MRDAVYLRQIRDFADEIVEIAGPAGAGLEERATYLASLHLIQCIGQAAGRLSDETRAKSPEIPWHGVIAMRNVIVHEYEHVEPDLVAGVVSRDLFQLREAVTRLLEELDERA
jgi:uncharacterized protein with HEPN domain